MDATWLVAAEIVGGFRPLGRPGSTTRSTIFRRPRPVISGWHALGRAPADSEKTCYHRAGTLAAFTNALVLVSWLWLGYESIERFRSPIDVVESWMIWTSLAA